MQGTISLCVIMVVRNESQYISQAIRSVFQRKDVVLYIVDDNSTDGTVDKIRSIASEYGDRIKFKQSCTIGKVDAYRGIRDLPVCDFYLFLDGDDFFSPAWMHFFPIMTEDTLYYQDLQLYFSEKRVEMVAHPRVDKKLKQGLISSLVLLPKVSWIIPRGLIYDFLDIPTGVEFEDIWFSLVSYKSAAKIMKVDSVWYLYRQHDRQVYGSQVKKGSDIVGFRYGRILRSLEAISRQRPEIAGLLAKSIARYRVLASNNFLKILFRLGPSAALLHMLKIYSPELLMRLKQVVRSEGGCQRTSHR